MTTFLMALAPLFAALALVVSLSTLLAVAWLVMIFKEMDDFADDSSGSEEVNS